MLKDLIDRAILEMVARGLKPAAIVMDPPTLKAFQRECSPQDAMFCDPKDSGSGWKYENIPIWRAWGVCGACVLDEEAFNQLRRGSYTRRWADKVTYEPILF